MLIRPETEADYAAVAEITAAAVPLSPYDAIAPRTRHVRAAAFG